MNMTATMAPNTLPALTSPLPDEVGVTVDKSGTRPIKGMAAMS